MTYGVVYLIRNKINGKGYVGQTTQPPENRFKQHSLRKSCPALTSAIRKYGVDAFEFSVLGFAKTKEGLDKREIKFIRDLNTTSPDGYNIKGGGAVGGHSRKTRLKISVGNKGKVRDASFCAAASKRMRGTTVPLSVRKKISETLAGTNYVSTEARAAGVLKRTGRHHSEDAKVKMSANRSGIPVSDEMKEKLRAANLGKTHSPETRARMSEKQRERWAARKETALRLQEAVSLP